MPYLTTQEAAARLGVTDAYIRQLVQRGLLKAQKLQYGPSGGVLAIDESEIERYAVNRRPVGRPRKPTRRLKDRRGSTS